MPTHSLIIPPEMEGRSIRSVALHAIGMSSGQFKRAKFQGNLMLDGVRMTADVRVKAGQQLELHVPDIAGSKPETLDIPLHIVYEDEYLYVIDKPAPLPLRPAPGGIPPRWKMRCTPSLAVLIRLCTGR